MITKSGHELVARSVAIAALSVEQRFEVAASLAKSLQADNPRFKKAAFYKACNLPNYLWLARESKPDPEMRDRADSVLNEYDHSATNNQGPCKKYTS